MSKFALRFPENSIIGGRIGTARIREQIAVMAAALESTVPVAIDAAIGALIGSAPNMNTREPGTPGVRGQRKASRKRGTGEKPAAGNRETPSGALSPIERMQQLGRSKKGKQNKTETAYENEVLKPQLAAGEILWYRFEAIKLRLADNTFITIDYPVITAAGQLEFREVKGRWTDDARAKTKVAASQYPFRFIAIQRVGRNGWRVEDLTGRGW